MLKNNTVSFVFVFLAGLLIFIGVEEFIEGDLFWGFFDLGGAILNGLNAWMWWEDSSWV